MCCAGALSMPAGETSRCGASARPINARSPWRNGNCATARREAEGVALTYRAKGLDAEDAERVAATIMKHREAALDTMAREELGLDPDELRTPWTAAVSSLGAFAAGAVGVVLPYMFSSGWAALIAAIVLASL